MGLKKKLKSGLKGAGKKVVNKLGGGGNLKDSDYLTGSSGFMSQAKKQSLNDQRLEEMKSNVSQMKNRLKNVDQKDLAEEGSTVEHLKRKIKREEDLIKNIESQNKQGRGFIKNADAEVDYAKKYDFPTRTEDGDLIHFNPEDSYAFNTTTGYGLTGKQKTEIYQAGKKTQSHEAWEQKRDSIIDKNIEAQRKKRKLEAQRVANKYGIGPDSAAESANLETYQKRSLSNEKIQKQLDNVQGGASSQKIKNSQNDAVNKSKQQADKSKNSGKNEKNHQKKKEKELEDDANKQGEEAKEKVEKAQKEGVGGNSSFFGGIGNFYKNSFRAGASAVSNKEHSLTFSQAQSKISSSWGALDTKHKLGVGYTGIAGANVGRRLINNQDGLIRDRHGNINNAFTPGNPFF